MSKTSKARRKEVRSKIRAIMTDFDQQERATWGKPPLWVRFVNLFRRGASEDWLTRRKAEHEYQLRKAFRKTHQQVRGM